jgi:hypothetical protein
MAGNELLGALLKPKQSELPPAPMTEIAPAPPAPSYVSDATKYIAERPVMSAITGLAGAAAIGVSYSRNQSVPWAIFHGIFGVPYLAYVGYETYQAKGSRAGVDWDPSAAQMFSSTQQDSRAQDFDELAELQSFDFDLD